MSEESIIGKFFGVLGLKVDHKGFDDFGKKVGSLKHSVEGIFALEVLGRFTDFVERSVGAAAAIQDFSEIIGMSAAKVDAFGRVAIDNSIGVEAMRSALQGVYRATGQAAMGLGRNVKLFQQLGLKAKDSSGQVKSAEEILGELADKFQKMDMSKVLATAGRMGIDSKLAATMKELGSSGIQKELTEALTKGLLSEADYRQADATEVTFKRFHYVVRQITTLIANQFAPWIQKAVKALEKFITENKVSLTKKFAGVMAQLSQVIGAVWEYGSKLYDLIVKLSTKLADSTRVAEAFRGILVAIALVKTAETVGKIAKAVSSFGKAAVVIPTLLGGFALLAVAIALLVEDWLSFQRGEESVIGDLETKWPRVFKVIKTTMEGLLSVWEYILAAAKSLGLIDETDEDKMGKPGSMKLYSFYKSGHFPKAGTPEAEDFVEMDRAWKDESHPWKQMEAGIKAQFSSAGSSLMAAKLAQPGGDPWGNQAGLWGVPKDSSEGATTVVNNKVDKIIIQADTDERARTAGKAVADTLGSTRVRNYQPRGS